MIFFLLYDQIERTDHIEEQLPEETAGSCFLSGICQGFVPVLSYYQSRKSYRYHIPQPVITLHFLFNAVCMTIRHFHNSPTYGFFNFRQFYGK